MPRQALVNIGSCNGLLPIDVKLSPEPMPTFDNWSPTNFGQFALKYKYFIKEYVLQNVFMWMCTQQYLLHWIFHKWLDNAFRWLKWKFYFREIFVIGCTGNCPFDSFRFSQWLKNLVTITFRFHDCLIWCLVCPITKENILLSLNFSMKSFAIIQSA